MTETKPSENIQEITVVVDGGYSPNTFEVKKGRLVRIIFDRQEAGSCSEEVVFPDLGIRKSLTPFGKTALEFLPGKTGNLSFHCGMKMVRGTLIVG